MSSDREQDDRMTINVPVDQQAVHVEFPGVVENVEQAIAALGGHEQIAKLVQSGYDDDDENAPTLRLNPDDPLRLPLESTKVESRKILLKVTVPKMTGRKRKRGSNEPFAFHPEDVNPTQERGDVVDDATPSKKNKRTTAEEDLWRLRQSLRDNPNAYTIEALGVSTSSYVFRTPPDFQYSTTDNDVANTLGEAILSSNYDKLKQFKPSKDEDPEDTAAELVPPPMFDTTGGVPNPYLFKRGKPRKSTKHAGRRISKGLRDPTRIIGENIPSTALTVPHQPSATFPPIDKLEPRIQATINELRAVFANRPICTKRYLLNTIENSHYDLPFALPYIAYVFRSGPWRDAYTAYGVDPRVDPDMRAFQTLIFKFPSVSSPTSSAPNKNPASDVFSPQPRQQHAPAAKGNSSHIFDGSTPQTRSHVWQACDITDPTLRGILDAPDAVRSTCHVTTDGWYANGALAKLKVLMRDKLLSLHPSFPPPSAPTDPGSSSFFPSAAQHDAETAAQANADVYAKILQIPNVLDESMAGATFARETNRKVLTLATEVRAIAKASLLKKRPEGSGIAGGATYDGAAVGGGVGLVGRGFVGVSDEDDEDDEDDEEGDDEDEDEDDEGDEDDEADDDEDDEEEDENENDDQEDNEEEDDDDSEDDEEQ